METCRTCAKCDFEKETNFICLFHQTNWANEIESIHAELNNWKLKVSQNDGLPQKICSDCFTKFCTIFTFRLACEEAQVKLTNIFDRIDESQGLESNGIDELEMSTKELMVVDNTNEEAQDLLLGYLAVHNDVDVGDIDNTGHEIAQFSDSNENPATIINLQRPTEQILHYTAALDVENGATSSTLPVVSNYAEQLLDSSQVKFVTTVVEQIIGENKDAEAIPKAKERKSTKRKARPLRQSSTPNELAFQIGELEIAFECQFCFKRRSVPGKRFSSQQMLLAHITEMHNSILPYNCPYCDQCFQDIYKRTTHIKDQHVEKNYECETCGKKYAHRVNLVHHVEKYHSETDFECTLCEKRFYSRKSLNYHMNWHDPERQLKCNYCDRLFINQRHLKCHESTHTGERTLEYCTFCSKAFTHIKTLRYHIYRQHGGKKPYKCRICPEVFASYLEKRIHMLGSHVENLTSIEKTECMLCHKLYENDIALKEHMVEHLESLRREAPPIIVTKNNQRVLQNKRKKRYSGIFQCAVCTQRFNMKSALERHAAMHSDSRPYPCDKCSKRFKREQDLNWHKRSHANETPNICDVCGKGFALKYVLTQHKKSHEVTEKNFVCSICGRSYLFEKTLRVHERSHTNQSYYKCDFCSKSFPTHGKLKSHLRKMHAALNTAKEHPLDELINIVIS